MPHDDQLDVEVETGTGALGLDLTRRLAAEALGTGFLVVAVIGSGIMASRLSPDDVGLQLLENAAATAGALVGLILMFGAVSGAHFNPVVTLVDRLSGTLTTRDGIAYVGAQVVGGCLGAIVANLMFELPAVEWSTTSRSSGALWFSEVVATVGLLLVIHGCVRTGRASAVPFAVGVWIGGAYFFTSSTSFANPAVTIARTMSDSFAGIKPSSAPMFIVMQLVGAAVAFVLIRFLYPRRQRLNALAKVEGLQPSDQPSVLFLCVHNAGRSQMAAGWMRRLAGDRVTVYSGGSEPTDKVNPAAVASMAEVGIDIANEVPKPWTDEIVRTSDVVVTMGCGDACPLFPGKRYEDWELDDPAGLGVAEVAPIRDEIRAHVEQLLTSLGIEPAAMRG
jgi:glycerol uptake facilitator-like aquaporin/protein-tyrosine-phosphatase